MYIYIYILFQILFPFRSLQNIKQHPLCYTVGPCWLSIVSLSFSLNPTVYKAHVPGLEVLWHKLGLVFSHFSWGIKHSGTRVGILSTRNDPVVKEHLRGILWRCKELRKNWKSGTGQCLLRLFWNYPLSFCSISSWSGLNPKEEIQLV